MPPEVRRRLGRVNSRALLGHVLREARETVNRSPEQAGEAAGVSGRTVRRLEEPGSDTSRPRLTTLDALASFYGLRQAFLRELGTWDVADEGLPERLRALAEAQPGVATAAELTDDENELTLLAMRLARGSGVPAPASAARSWDRLFLSLEGGHQSVEAEVWTDLLGDFLALDRRRQSWLRDLAHDLRAASERERVARRDD